MKIEKGVKTRPQYHFQIKSFYEKETFYQMKKTASLIISPINIGIPKNWNMIMKMPIGILAVYDFSMITPHQTYIFS